MVLLKLDIVFFDGDMPVGRHHVYHAGLHRRAVLHGHYRQGAAALQDIFEIAGPPGVKVLGQLSAHRLARTLFVAGAVAWLYSQTSDVLLNPIDAFRWTITPEETGESLGSALWLFSFVIWLRSVLPIGFMPPEPSAGQLNGHAIIKPLHETEREQMPTG